jgi:hypothetical protein
MKNVTAVQWLGEARLVAGMADGSLYVFNGVAAIKALAAHRPGPQAIQPDGHPAHTGVRGLRLAKGGTVLLSGVLAGQGR